MALLRAIYGPDEKPCFRTVPVVIPPFEDEPSAFLDRLKAVFPEAASRWIGIGAAILSRRSIKWRLAGPLSRDREQQLFLAV